MTSPLKIDVEVDALDVKAKMQRLDIALSDQSLESFLRNNARDYIWARVESRFNQEGDDVTGPWQPLSQATVAMRRALGYPGPGPINFRTGDMFTFLEGAPGVTTGSGTVEWEFPGPGMSQDIFDKLQTAQKGKNNPRTVPRPVLGMNHVDSEFITGELADFIRGALI